MHYVYILKCVNNSIYIGCTSNSEERLSRHKKGKIKSTKERTPVKMILYIVFPLKYKAFIFEKYLKSGSGRAFVNKHLL